MIPKGLCQCGCGKTTNLARENEKRWGHIKGQPVRFISGHKSHREGSDQRLDSQGYALSLFPNHPRANCSYVRTHILIAEKALDKPLPSDAVIHHVNGSKDNGQLVVCQDQNYHMLLHRRKKAIDACGHASWRKCWICKAYDNPINLVFCKHNIYHKECARKYEMGRNRSWAKSFKEEGAPQPQ
jgi:hypothetical protein